MTLSLKDARTRGAVATGALVVIAVIGLYEVKWRHYYEILTRIIAGASLGKPLVAPSSDLAVGTAWQAGIEYLAIYWQQIWKALFLALLIGSGIKAIIPSDWIKRTLGQESIRAHLVSSVAAVPSMMCTCCAVPVTQALREAGAAYGASLIYWLANPLLNPATLVLTAVLLGRFWFALRLGCGILLTFGCGIWCAYTYCSETPQALNRATRFEQYEPLSWHIKTIVQRWAREFCKIGIFIIPEYVALVVLLGGLRSWILPSSLMGAGNNLSWIMGMAFAGTLFVIPTAAEVPIVQTLLSLGVGTGPVAALLVTLPAVSLPSLLAFYRVFPRKLLTMVALATVSVGVLAGTLAAALQSN